MPIGLAVLLLVALLSPPPAGAQASAAVRFDANDPTTAAVLVSQARFAPDAATTAVLATTADYADALAGAALPILGPLLFTDPAALPDSTATELDRVLPAGSEVLILGGPAAVGDGVLAALQERGFTTRRLFGPSRFETAIEVAREAARISDPPPSVLLARGDAPADNPTAGWADAISGSTVGLAILLSSQASLHPATAAYLDETYGPGAEVTLLGGEAALSAQVQAGVPADLTTSRVAGQTRDATAVAVANRAGQGDSGVVLYDGFALDGWAYGLTGATFAQDNGFALLPVHPTATAQATADFVCAREGSLTVMGSAAVVSDATIDRHSLCGSVDPSPSPQPAQVVLSGTGLTPDAQLGGDGQQAVESVTASLGAPVADEARACLNSDDTYRAVTYGGPGGLTLYLYAESGPDVFTSWDLGDGAGLDLATDRGIGLGSTNAQIQSAYPDGEFEDNLNAWFLPPGDLEVQMDGAGDGDVAISFLAGGTNLPC